MNPFLDYRIAYSLSLSLSLGQSIVPNLYSVGYGEIL